MAKFWPLHHYNQCMGENREKHSTQLVGEGACQPDIFTTYRLGCELSYGTCPISLCAVECSSPILSHTLIVVVQWPKFGHSTTFNNKGYKAHKEMGHVP